MKRIIIVGMALPSPPRRSLNDRILCGAGQVHEEVHHRGQSRRPETTVVGGMAMYKTKTEAETGMKTVKVCTN